MGFVMSAIGGLMRLPHLGSIRLPQNGTAGSLVIGIAGYHWLGPMGWIDAFVNAAMLLGGMGPVGSLDNNAIKLFAGCYALYCGVVFIATVGLVLAPVGAHVLRRFHLDQKN